MKGACATLDDRLWIEEKKSEVAGTTAARDPTRTFRGTELPSKISRRPGTIATELWRSSGDEIEALKAFLRTVEDRGPIKYCPIFGPERLAREHAPQ